MTAGSDTETDSRSRFGGLVPVIGWIIAGALSVAALMLALDSVADVPLSRSALLGLGLALGGGIGGVANFLQMGETTAVDDETMTVTRASTETTEPTPADLFDGHPDPVLYYTEVGHGPVVRAANTSFGDTFDVPTDRLSGTPLSEALLVAGTETVDVEPVTAGGLDCIVTCETASGPAPFRLRTVGNETTGYLLYTPVTSD